MKNLLKLNLIIDDGVDQFTINKLSKMLQANGYTLELIQPIDLDNHVYYLYIKRMDESK